MLSLAANHYCTFNQSQMNAAVASSCLTDVNSSKSVSVVWTLLSVDVCLLKLTDCSTCMYIIISQCHSSVVLSYAILFICIFVKDEIK